MLVDIVGADEEEDVAEAVADDVADDVAEEELFLIFVGEFNFIALEYNGRRWWGCDLIATCGDDLLCLLDLDDDDDEFDDVCEDVDLSLESDNNIVLLAMSAVQELIIIGFDDIYVDSWQRWIRASEAYLLANVAAGSLGTSLNLLYFRAIGVSTFSIYSFCIPIFLALKSDNLWVLRLYSTAYSIYDVGCG